MILVACFPMLSLAVLPAVESLFATFTGEKGALPGTCKLVALGARFGVVVASPRLHFVDKGPIGSRHF